MASAKILESKKAVVNEIEDLIKNSESVVLFSYQGLSVSDLSKLRRELKEKDGEVRVFKNTLVKRALDDLKIDLDGFLEGPNAIMFGHELLEPIKVLSKFAKENDKAEIRVGIISDSPADLKTINEYASIPSREGLLTMLAGGMIQYVRDLAIGLNLYAEQLEK
jgi:large subunit ribosomal protein L10